MADEKLYPGNGGGLLADNSRERRSEAVLACVERMAGLALPKHLMARRSVASQARFVKLRQQRIVLWRCGGA